MRANRMKMDKLLAQWKKRKMLEALDLFDQAMAQEEQAIIEQMNNEPFGFFTTSTEPIKYDAFGNQAPIVTKKDAIYEEAIAVRTLLDDAVSKEHYELAAELQKVLEILRTRYERL